MQGAKITPHSNTLAQVVCDWQPSKLSELAKAFSDSCLPPQVTFSSYDSYKAYFEPLLLTEVAAELLSATEKYQRSAPARHSKIRSRREEAGSTIALVATQKPTRRNSVGFGWSVDLDPHDRKGPIGSVDNDVVALWPGTASQDRPRQRSGRAGSVTQSRRIPASAVCAVVVRPIGRNGCRVVLTKFPDGNEHGARMDLEDGEENEEQPPSIRLWNVLRLGSLTTMKREFDALQKIKTSVLLPTLLRPKSPSMSTVERERQELGALPDPAVNEEALGGSADGPQKPRFRNEEAFTGVIAKKTGLNLSQSRAIVHASTCRNGFAVIQGPPGTGKTRTLISLLNVIHMTQYQEYYESLLASFEPMLRSIDRQAEREVNGATQTRAGAVKAGHGSLLSGMMVAMNKTLSVSSADRSFSLIPKRVKRPRLLICAPSNSAVDEILTRLTRCKFVDGQGREYCPELARIGAGDRVSDAAKPFTAEGQAETFLDRVCGEEMTPEAQKKAQSTFLSSWQTRCNALLVQLERTPKKPSSHSTIIDLHEKLERMDRDLRRLSVAASDGMKSIKREEKLRQIARTYVEDAQLVFATLSGSASNILTKNGSGEMASEGPLFDTVVIDEGAQATEPSCLIPIALGATRCLLVGDPQQLPATVLSSGAAGLAYGQSLLERVCHAGQNVQLLDTQYRMHPAISSFPRRYFYSGRLVDDESVQGDHRAKSYHRDAVRPKLGPYVFLDIAEGEEQRSRDDRSIFNRAEAELASLIYSKLKKEYPSDSLFSAPAKVPGSVTGFGVVTPYKRQMQELRQSFDRAGIPTGDVEIDTVDSFQGREKDVIVFSCVRTAAENRGIGFVRDVRRMNVGLTRARSSLIILGSAQALAEGSADWAELVEDASSRGCLISVGNVDRCLDPSPRNKSRLVSSGGEEAERSKHHDTAANRKLQVSQQKSMPGSGRTDPRRRAGRKGPSLELPQKGAQVALKQRESGVPELTTRVQEIAHGSSAQKDLKPSVSNLPSQVKAPAMSTLHSLDANAEEHSLEKSSKMQMLDCIRNVLADAGVRNVQGACDVLDQYMDGGGALDSEAIMAAALTADEASTPQTTSSDPSAAAKVAAVGYGSEPVSGTASTKENEAMKRITGHASPAPQESAREISSSKENGREVDSANTASLDRSRRVRPSDGDSNFKSGVRGQTISKRERSQIREPSGWDMLFASRKDGTGAENGEVGKESEDQQGGRSVVSKSSDVSVDQREHDVANGHRKYQDIVAGSGKKEDQTVLEEDTDSVKLPKAEDLQRSPSRDEKPQLASPTGKLKKNWNEKARDFDRKRLRVNDYGSGRGAGRGDRGRHHVKRGRGRGSFQDYGQHNRYNRNEQWVHEPNYGQYPMLGSGFEHTMNPGGHSVDSMQAVHQQAMQQQAMQQHLMHQQVLSQQRAMQHHAMQHQVMQQQAMHQQEAYVQHAALMQMSASPAGVPHGAMPSQPTAGADFEFFNEGMNSSSAISQGSGNWSGAPGRGRAGRSGRSGRGGRGGRVGRVRGRGKYGRGK